MKYRQWQSFKKSLDQANLDASAVTMSIIICLQQNERRRFIEKTITVLRKQHRDLEVLFLDRELANFSHLIEKLEMKSLFDEVSCVVFDPLDKVKKNELEYLKLYLERPSSFVHVIFGSSSAKGVELFEKKGIPIFDLEDEKPWEKKTRLKEEIKEKVRECDKNLSEDTIEALLSQVGENESILDKEIEKLLCFVGERREIKLEDFYAVSALQKEEEGWNFAETMVWKGGVFQEKSSLEDFQSVLPLIGQLRYHLQLGKELAALVEQGASTQEIHAFFPRLRESSLTKYLKVVKEKGLFAFKRRIEMLFEIELLAKNSSLSPKLILDLLILKLSSDCP